jgi:hypothetical protein
MSGRQGTSAIKARETATIHLKVGTPLKGRMQRACKTYLLSMNELVRLSLVHYLDNHTDSSGGESLIMKE